MSLIETVLAFVFTILLIVTIHEYGHYLCMRLFGIRVLKFSVGFGPRLVGWTSRKTGTEYVIAAFPLGGFVKPYDSRADNQLLEGGQGDVVASDDEDFSKKPAWQRLITYAAGPFANFVLAFVLYWIIALHGQWGLIPTVGNVVPDSVAAAQDVQPGDRVLSVNGEKVSTWQDVNTAMLSLIGTNKPAQWLLQSQGEKQQVSLSLGDWATNPQGSPLSVLGVAPKPPGTQLGKIIEGSAAEKAGLQAGDEVKKVNGEPVSTWTEWANKVAANPGKELSVTVQRHGELVTLTLVPTPVKVKGKTQGRAGVMIGGLAHISYGPLEAIPEAWHQLKEETSLIALSVWRLLEGNLSVKTLGGPITIAKAAGQTAEIGLVVFLGFLAFFSISLGILNLFPIPMLDGGWMVFSLYEMIMRRPLPERFLNLAQGLGFSLVMLLMAVAIYNDVIRQFG